MPDVVRMPLSPAALEGLANLRGTVLPVINLRSVFGFEQVEHDDATRVVVLDQGRPVGLVVDRMANVVTVEADDIEAADTIQSTVDTNLLTGMIKGRDGSSMVMILDAGNPIKRRVPRSRRQIRRRPWRGIGWSAHGRCRGGEVDRKRRRREPIGQLRGGRAGIRLPDRGSAGDRATAGARHRGAQHRRARSRRDHAAQSAAAAGQPARDVRAASGRGDRRQQGRRRFTGRGHRHLGRRRDGQHQGGVARGSLGDRRHAVAAWRRTARSTTSSRSAGWTTASASSPSCRRARCSTSPRCASWWAARSREARRWRTATTRRRHRGRRRTTTRSSSSCSA